MKSAQPKVLHELCGRPMLWYVARGAARARDRRDRRRRRTRSCEPSSAPFGVRRVVQEAAARHRSRRAGRAGRARAARGHRLVVAYGDMPLVDRRSSRTCRPVDADAGRARLGWSPPRCRCRRTSGAWCVAEGTVERIVELRDATPDRARDRRDECRHLRFRRARVARCVIGAFAPRTHKASIYLTDTVAVCCAPERAFGGARGRRLPFVLGMNDRVELAQARNDDERAAVPRAYARGRYDRRSRRRPIWSPSWTIGGDTVLYPNTTIARLSEHRPELRPRTQCRLSNAKLGDRVTVRESVFTDPTIGDDVWIGPFAHLRGETRLGDKVHVGNFVEIKKSNLARRVKVSHLSYLGDATIGEEQTLAPERLPATSTASGSIQRSSGATFDRLEYVAHRSRYRRRRRLDRRRFRRHQGRCRRRTRSGQSRTPNAEEVGSSNRKRVS